MTLLDSHRVELMKKTPDPDSLHFASMAFVLLIVTIALTVLTLIFVKWGYSLWVILGLNLAVILFTVAFFAILYKVQSNSAPAGALRYIRRKKS